MASPFEPDDIARLHAGEMRFSVETFVQTVSNDGSFDGVRLMSDTDEIVCDNEVYYPTAVDPEMVRRIIACLQHCHGLTTEEMEKINGLLGTNT